MSIRHRRAARRYAQLLEEAEADGGPRHRAGTRDDADLAEMVAIGRELPHHAPTPEVDPEFRAGLRAMLVATAEREGIGDTASVPGPTALSSTASGARVAADEGGGDDPGTRGGQRSPLRRWPRTRTAVITGVTVGAVAAAGISAASDGAVPGDALYSVKRSTERAQLALANSDAGRGQLYLDFARNRRAEAETLASDLSRVLRDMDRDTTLGVRLLTSTADDRQDPAALAVVDEFVTEQRGSLAPLADALDGGDRRAVTSSLRLLADIEERTQELRAAISDGCDATDTDSLGPVPDDCQALPWP